MGRVLATNFSTESNWFDQVSNSKLIPKATGTHRVHILEHCPFPNLHFVQQNPQLQKPYFLKRSNSIIDIVDLESFQATNQTTKSTNPPIN